MPDSHSPSLKATDQDADSHPRLEEANMAVGLTGAAVRSCKV